MTGRPTLRTDEVIQRILDGLTAGTPLEHICRADDMPATRTVRDWMDSDADLFAAIARAREMGADAIAVESLEIIDTMPDIVKSEGGDRVDSAHVAWLKNRAEHRLKLLAKWHPKRYGDKVTLAGDAENPVEMRARLTVDMARLSTHALQEIAALPVPDDDDADGR